MFIFWSDSLAGAGWFLLNECLHFLPFLPSLQEGREALGDQEDQDHLLVPLIKKKTHKHIMSRRTSAGLKYYKDRGKQETRCSSRFNNQTQSERCFCVSYPCWTERERYLNDRISSFSGMFLCATLPLINEQQRNVEETESSFSLLLSLPLL